MSLPCHQCQTGAAGQKRQQLEDRRGISASVWGEQAISAFMCTPEAIMLLAQTSFASVRGAQKGSGDIDHLNYTYI